ncbi:MAG: efflux RND transporter permease subunit [Pseudophaeobacter sp. bin_em_oilr2.035]|uniref:Efflux RND transporter permease subunit n=1 Tax=Phaeobacter gallaeciensis TaxID=60890 RepID=A0ABD4XBB2_9RHOB|nr:efflux RND transporter permease subunit [Phaeobacter gallaeciensis]MDF1771604.1 efflux RND transporter permease subunit [Pseudophaeobacter sp. bin_em_oilr2.035]MDE4145328.1 efflux RND transporter permease subunit [Phaeobacter gallaeciensis]MDE4157999.1 efflux RND transporter permease subunit [Phaeobacter gallaeciensis]MDE4162178.1 efflux RND transporter permease subunit [Phaeobacter gallaeciensis]MDE4166404.1 efflux RND transporter permease subunit [Phaeobacter gallaeciensis]
MDIARGSIEKPLYTWLIMLIALFGGIWGFLSLGRLEDPAFTIKQAVIVTQYQGATAEQVALEVSEPLESAIQKMAEVDIITSINQPGQSLIEVEIKSTYDGSELPAVWTKLRAKIRDAALSLPEGTSQPFVNDAFGDVFGLFYAVTADGFSDAEKHELATFLRRELLTVDGVADVDVSGLPDEAIYVEPDLPISVNLNVPLTAIANAIATSNSVRPAGKLDAGDADTRLLAPQGSDSVSEIAGLSVGVQGEVINVIDMAKVHRGRVADPDLIVRYNGAEAFTLGVAGIASENIVDVGKNVDAKLAQLDSDIPYGVSLQPIYQQHVVVEQASNDFLVNLAMSVAIVVVVLALFMGMRAAIVVGVTLLLTVVGTLLFMNLFSIEMERISLGALIIAMGMLVDNAIVVAEGMQISMLRGKNSREAAHEAASKTQIPLLGATVIGIMAFAGIGLSPDSTGEFLFSLFAVIGISLLLSWLLALTVTPLLGHYFFKRGTGGGGDEYGGLIFRAYGASLRLALKLRWLVVVGLIALTTVCYIGFGQVKQAFFPDSNTPLFFVHLKLPQGTSIHTTSAQLQRVEDWLAERPDVESTAAFVGQGATRFMLTYSAEKANPSYGHLIIRASSLQEIPALQADLEAFGRSNFPEAEFRTKRLVFGPGGGDPVQVRFSGPDPAVLRQLGEEAMVRLKDGSDSILSVRHNWREQELVLEPIYATDRAQTAGITREDIAGTLQFSTDGVTAGMFRERDRQIPIILRRSPEDQFNIMDQLVFSTSSNRFMPLEQMIDGVEIKVQNTLMHRRDRVFTLTVGADIAPDVTAATVFKEVQNSIEEIALPPGYRMEWGGEHESSADANKSLGAQLPVSLLIMVLISVLLFNAIRQPVIIWLLVPMSVNGVVIGLLGTGLPFTFTALLGLLSLSGMLIKNGIVLVEEIDLVRAEGRPLREAIVEASVSRLRPVMLAAITTILGMAPLLSDAFFVSMAITIMGGLAFATVLTLVAAPVFYLIFFARDEKRETSAA